MLTNDTACAWLGSFETISDSHLSGYMYMSNSCKLRILLCFGFTYSRFIRTAEMLKPSSVSSHTSHESTG